MNTLADYRHKRKYKAGDGEEGGKRRCHGADGEDIVLKVPPGTIIKEKETGKVILDMSNKKEPVVLLKGGRGGKGNQHYATAVMQAPKYAQPGGKCQELEVTLELKSNCRCGTGRLSKCGEIHVLIKGHQCKAQDCKLSFYNTES